MNRAIMSAILTALIAAAPPAHATEEPEIDIEVRGAYKFDRHTVSLMLRNNLQSGFSRGTFEVDWSFPIYRRVRGYAQYFNGYGESLIDYDVHTNTLGVGLSFTDYF